jgi:predicted regulator of Ras-like GTPase activity (Roadblock/LC7/MglB family)
MTDSNLKPQLDKIVNDLAKIEGVDGNLIVTGNGELLSHHIRGDVDISLFGPMVQVISSSSQNLTESLSQGETERVLMESQEGKALFLHLGNVNFIVLMKNDANVGLVMVSSKRAAQEIVELTKDLTALKPEEVAKEEPTIPETHETPSKEIPEPPVTKIQETAVTEIPEPPATKIIETAAEKTVSDESQMEIRESESLKSELQVEVESRVSDVEKGSIEKVSEEPLKSPVEELTKEEELKPTIPIIKPPISFPAMLKVEKVPENVAERSELILNIYESIFMAMSIGASKIMGVTPTRGLNRKFLPVEQCKKLLDGVDVNNNSTIDFEKIRENAERIPPKERETSFIENFSKIIAVIIENYGKIMGYSAFKGMVRPEFKAINYSYGLAIKELGIQDKMHPELLDLFE